MNPYLNELKKHFDMPRFYATLNRESLVLFARSVALEELTAPEWREEVYPVDDTEFVEFLGWTSSINFHFTDLSSLEKFKTFWPECRHCRQQKYLYKEIGKYEFRCVPHDNPAKLWGGSYAMDACFMRALREDGIPLSDPKFLRSREWNLEMARFVFRGASPTDVIPMLDERHLFLQISATRLQDFGDSWLNILRITGHKAFGNSNHWPGTVEILAEKFGSFADLYNMPTDGSGAIYQLPFHKRAHLFALMYEGRARSSKVLKRLKDASSIMLPADYELPRALRAIGALNYFPETLVKIVNKQEIAERSREEVEIRLSTVEAGEILKREINAARSAAGKGSYSVVEIDYLLWTKGRALQEPHHLTRTTRY